MGVYIKRITKELLKYYLAHDGSIISDDRLIEVEEPHGDLIDLNEVTTFNVYDEETEEHYQENMTIRNALSLWAERMPRAAIEAEGE